jgi:hypothetical protein
MLGRTIGPPATGTYIGRYSISRQGKGRRVLSGGPKPLPCPCHACRSAANLAAWCSNIARVARRRRHFKFDIMRRTRVVEAAILS